jgi:hypothetical protein
MCVCVCVYNNKIQMLTYDPYVNCRIAPGSSHSGKQRFNRPAPEYTAGLPSNHGHM